MKNKTVLLFIVLIIVSSLIYQNYANHTPDHIRIADKLRYQTVNKIKRKYDIKLVGIRDRLVDCVRLSGASFDYVGKKTQDEARLLIVPIVQMYLDEFNQNEEIRPFLVNYPFTLNNIQITIFLNDKKNYTIYDPYIGVVSCDDGNIYYRTNDPKDRFNYKNRYQETFEEALSILESQGL